MSAPPDRYDHPGGGPSFLTEFRLRRLEDHVQQLENLMGPLKIMPDAELGEPQTALEFLSYLVGIQKGKLEALTERVQSLERRRPGDPGIL